MEMLELAVKLALGALVVIFLVMICTKKGRMFLKAAVDSLFTEANKNPRIVSEYYDRKIEELQENYEKAAKAYEKAAGEKHANEVKLKTLSKQLEQINRSVMAANSRGDNKNARMYAEEALAIKSEIEATKENIPIFEDAMRSAGDLKERASSAISMLKNRKKSDLAKAEAGKAAQEIYASFDESRVSSDIDRVLDQFSDFADEQEKLGWGARAAYEDSYEYKRSQAEKESRKYQADDYINSLINSVGENSGNSTNSLEDHNSGNTVYSLEEHNGVYSMQDKDNY